MAQEGCSLVSGGDEAVKQAVRISPIRRRENPSPAGSALAVRLPASLTIVSETTLCASGRARFVPCGGGSRRSEEG
jgi:hypothetical protein